MNIVYTLLVILIIVCIVGLIYIYYYNKIQDAKLRIDEAERIIDDNLRIKYDLMINIKTEIRKTTKSKKIDFKDLESIKDMDISNFDLDRKLIEQLTLLDTIIEDHDKLKENDVINKYLIEIKNTDEKIDSAKMFFNNYITELNTLASKFPSAIIANLHNIKVKPYFDNKNMHDDDINDFKL